MSDSLAVPKSSKSKKKNEYHAIQSEEEQSLISSNNSSADKKDSRNRHRSPKKKRRRRSSSKHGKDGDESDKSSRSLWLLLTNASFIFFVINCLVPFVIALWCYMLWPDISSPFILSGIIGITVTVYAFRSFKQLMGITAGVNAYAAKNARFKAAHKEVQTHVAKVTAANHELKETENRLRASMNVNRENLTQFRQVQGYMKQLDVKDFKPFVDKAQWVSRRWREQLLDSERRMLHVIFDRFEMAHDGNGRSGMSEQEFNELVTFVPTVYQERFARLGTFEKLSNNKGILEYADFEVVLDVFVEMVVDNVDIEMQVVHEASHLQPADISRSLISASEYSACSDDSEDSGGVKNYLARLLKWKSQRRNRDPSVNIKVVVSAHNTPVGLVSPILGDFYEDMFGAIDMERLFHDGSNKSTANNSMMTLQVQRTRPLLNLSENPENIVQDLSVSTIDNMNINDVEEASFTDREMDNFMKKTMQKNV
eukprot:CAMPEP_0202698594 /NCGR_PEP_ID=MMETSP1385-20130828/11865_1 /ASSEMBLY_ACC=CAM_ASM_000861 /TAXON_ID=933848 /ORGANISM="Elphidium margaritaceum" /LENGTH=481 /DNA_ID=CAMNT_0049355347 /DNA_START=20 /DNA_END=1462 /DNA_ORIENTATION=-